MKKQEVKKTQEEFRQNYCDCVNAKANDHFTPERIKEANKQNKFNEENADGTPKAMTMNEMLFFVGAQTKCMSGITSKYSMWLDAFIN